MRKINLTEEIFKKEIENIVDQLIRFYKPQKIILFGSLAKENVSVGADTDIDLFIIKKDVPKLGVDRVREVERLVNYKLATDFIIYTPEEVEERIQAGDPFVRKVISEGEVLYDEEQEGRKGMV